MTLRRKIVKIYTPQEEDGFLGAGHKARPLVIGSYHDTDPFIALMDDQLNKKDYSQAGGPHPHAGFETVSLLVDGKITEMLETMKKGDFHIMTAGSGIVHTETINEPTNGRLFQLWLNLPKKDRWTIPRLQILPGEHVPESEQDGIGIRLYSGSLDNLRSPILNYTSLIVAEINLKPGLSTSIWIPASFNSFLVILDGMVAVGENETPITKDQVCWLNLYDINDESELILKTWNQGVRLVLYAAKPLGEEFVSHGPFIGDSQEDIKRLYQEYRAGKMAHISTTPEDQRITY